MARSQSRERSGSTADAAATTEEETGEIFSSTPASVAEKTGASSEELVPESRLLLQEDRLTVRGDRLPVGVAFREGSSLPLAESSSGRYGKVRKMKNNGVITV